MRLDKVWVVARKDISEFRTNKYIMYSLVIMPLIMAIACRYMHLTPAEALVASTINAAYAIGRGADLGRLQPGYAADLLILDADDYRQLSYRFGTNLVQMVIKRGQIVFQA